jgi:hypothetical protein
LGQVGAKLGPGWGQVGAKLTQVRDPKSDDFLITFWIHFGRNLVPTSLQLGSQTYPKLESNWVAKAMKTATSENPKIIQKL